MTRYRFLDVLRGFALLGILLVNVLDIATPHGEPAGRAVLDLAVQSRFVPIFTLMFGVSLYLIAGGARRRGTAGWSALALRMLALGAIGAVHMLLYSGDILRSYAIGGLLVIPLVVWLPAWINLLLGTALTGLAFGLGSGGVETLPGLMLVGAGAAGLGVPALLEGSRRFAGVLLALSVAVAAPLLWRYLQAGGGDPRFSVDGARAGLCMAVGYIAVLALLWQLRPVRRVLAAVFEPLGRMSLTNYVGASLVTVVAAPVLGLAAESTIGPTSCYAVVLILVQSAASRLWLAHFRYGPLEWVVRAATWRTRPPFRRDPGPSDPAAARRTVDPARIDS
ncbi:DUF418 domain-containing protein [Tsukamurella spumae]|uniref:DUF418 domain-containing protein n=1 Tax=Tsukamurella spumae TaxID=44753 RepID=A0A846X2W1_9ACTN|nr:DUF418 domain-containing protein [Tsukamurella spumae]NKY18220.1 DUF418 domain-containing protein [Tsukamurella spumae]